MSNNYTDNKPSWEDFRRWLNPHYKPEARRRSRATAQPEVPKEIEAEEAYCRYMRTPWQDCYGEENWLSGCGKRVDRSKTNFLSDTPCAYCGKIIKGD